jgi:hypothetical protein
LKVSLLPEPMSPETKVDAADGTPRSNSRE